MSLEQVIQRNNELLEIQLSLMDQLIIEVRLNNKLAESIRAERTAGAPEKPADEAAGIEEQKQDRADAVIKAENAGKDFTQEPEPAAEDAPQQDPVAYTISDIRAQIVRLTDAKGKPAVLRLLQQFKANKVSELSEDDYTEVVDKIEEILSLGGKE